MRQIVFTGLLIALPLVTATGRAEVRKWTDDTGTHCVMGEFVKLDGTTVILKLAHSKEVRVPIERISKEDQDYVRQKSAPKSDNPFSSHEDVLPRNAKSTAPPPSDEAEDAGTLREVVATGKGSTEDEARRDAFRNAVEQAVGVYVDATTIANNDQIIEDSVLTYSNAYVKSFTVIRSLAGDGIYRIKIRAMVKMQRLAEKLKSQGIKIMAVDGQSLAAEIVTRKRMEEDGVKLLKYALGDFPLQFVEFSPYGKITPSPKGGLDAVVRCSVNKERYRKYIASLAAIVKQQASETATDTLSTRVDITPYIEFFPNPTPSPTRQLFERLRKYRGDHVSWDHFVILLGKSVQTTTDQSKKRMRYLVVTWYIVNEHARPVVLQALRRCAGLMLHCELKDNDGQTVAEMTARPCFGKQGSFLVPCNKADIANGGLQLTHLGMSENVDSENGVIIFPALTLEEKTSGSWIAGLEASVDIVLHFDVSPDEIAKVRNLAVTSELPPAERLDEPVRKTGPGGLF